MRFKATLSAASLFAVPLLAVIALVTQPRVMPMVSTVPQVDPARLAAHVRHLSVALYPRSFEQFRNLEGAARYIEQAFHAAGAAVSRQAVIVEESTYHNVIARFGPAEGPLLVVGAHYDTDGDIQAGARHRQGFAPQTHTPGADDNASGVAGLLELAHLLGQQPPVRPVELVAYTLEELPYFRTPHMGSAWHARALAAAGREVRLMLALEMIGYFSDAPDSQDFPLPGMGLIYPTRGNFIALVGRFGDFPAMRRTKALMRGATPLPVHSINAPPAVPGVDFSDHRNYWAAGYPALMVTDTAFYRNPHYHGAGDTPDTLDYRRMAQVVQGVYAVVQGY